MDDHHERRKGEGQPEEDDLIWHEATKRKRLQRGSSGVKYKGKSLRSQGRDQDVHQGKSESMDFC